MAVQPLYKMLLGKLGEKSKLTAGIFTVLMLAILLVPTIQLASSVTDSVAEITERWQTGAIKVEPPNESVKDWPLIGEKSYAVWKAASVNLEKTLLDHQSQVRKIFKSLFSAVSGAGFGVL